MKGEFKWFKREKGYGFIVGEDSKEYFVHYSSLPYGQRDISQDDQVKVDFEVKKTDRGVQAVDVKFIKSEE